MNLKLVIFSGTGNTRLIANKITEQCKSIGIYDCEILEIDYLIKNKIKLKMNKESIIGIGYPVYDFKPPIIVEDYLNDYIDEVNGNKSFVFSTYTSMALDSNAHVINKLIEKKFNVIKSINLKSPGASGFIYSNPENIMVKKSTVFEKDINLRINKLVNDIINESSDNLHPQFNRFNKIHQKASKIIFGTLFYKNLKIDDNCSKCTICINNCPISNIEFKDENIKINDKNGCLKCLRCVQNCPNESINFTSTKRKGNYKQDTIEKKYIESSFNS